jgi:hypothetical protein
MSIDSYESESEGYHRKSFATNEGQVFENHK